MSDARETPSTGPQGGGRPDDAPGRSGADEPTTADDLADRDVPAEPDEPVVVAPAQVEPVAAAGPVTADRARTPEDGEQQPTATSSPAPVCAGSSCLKGSTTSMLPRFQESRRVSP